MPRPQEAATILDPFMGSGATGAACQNTSRRFIGVELSEPHFETARQSLTQ
ncbi:MAG: DNA methyltransferase [Pseudomonadota bacterium]